MGAMLRTYSEEQIRRVAPSVYTTTPSERVSAKYQLFNTAAVIPVLDAMGWKVVSARQTITRLADNTPFVKHMLEFGHKDFALKEHEVGDLQMRIGIVNSHDAKNAVGIFGRMLRTWCANQATVVEQMFGDASFRHTLDMTQVRDSVYQYVKNIPPLGDKIDYYRSIATPEQTQLDFAHEALAIRWGDAAPIDEKALLAVRRGQDTLSNLWGLYQTVQENLTKGGQEYQAEGKRKNKTRAISSIDSDLQINGKLWTLMTAFAAARR